MRKMERPYTQRSGSRSQINTAVETNKTSNRGRATPLSKLQYHRREEAADS